MDDTNFILLAAEVVDTIEDDGETPLAKRLERAGDLLERAFNRYYTARKIEEVYSMSRGDEVQGYKSNPLSGAGGAGG